MGHSRPLFPFLSIFSYTSNTENCSEVRDDRTRISELERRVADHYITTTGQVYLEHFG